MSAAASSSDKSSTTITVIAGLIVGIALVVIFGFVFSDTGKATYRKSVFDFQKGQSVNLRMDIPDMPNVVEIGTAVQPIIRIAGTVTGCAPPPHAEIRDIASSKTVWDSGLTTVFCDPDARPGWVNIAWVLGKAYVENGVSHPRSTSAMIAEKTGTYELTVEYAGLKERKMFDVVNSKNQEKLLSVAKNLPIVNSFLSQYPNATASVLEKRSEISSEFTKFNPSAILQYSVERQLYLQEGERHLQLSIIFDANDAPSNTILECKGPISTTVINSKPDLLADVERCIQN